MTYDSKEGRVPKVASKPGSFLMWGGGKLLTRRSQKRGPNSALGRNRGIG